MKNPPAIVLQVINKGRIALGKKPLKHIPKGRPGESAFCPVHNAFWKSGWLAGPRVRLSMIDNISVEEGKKLAKTWRTKYKMITPKHGVVSLPILLQKFISAVDGEKYPQLIRKG